MAVPGVSPTKKYSRGKRGERERGILSQPDHNLGYYMNSTEYVKIAVLSIDVALQVCH